MTKSWKHHIICLNNCFIAMLIAVLLLPGCSQQSSIADDAYNYPIKPGTEEWKALGGHDRMLESCQIPENILKNMSTKGLVETVLNYPLLFDMMAYNSIQFGYDQVVSKFNGLQELFNRKDAGIELFARYRTMDPTAIDDDWTLVEKGHYTFGFQHIEVILAQEPILKNLTSVQRRDLLEECFIKYQGKQQLIDIYGKFGHESVIRLMGKILQQEHYASFTTKVSEDTTLQAFLNSGSFSNDLVRSEILSQAEQFLSIK